MHARQRSRLLRTIPFVLLAAVTFVLYSFQFTPIFHSKKDVHRIQVEEEVKIQLQQKVLEEQRQRERLQFIHEHRSVLEPVVTASDEGMNHLAFTHNIAVPVPVKPWTDEDKAMLRTALGQSLQADLLTYPENVPDFKYMTFQQRVFKALFQYFDPLIAAGDIDVTTHPDHKDSWDLFVRLERTLYPWLKPNWDNAFDINKSTRGRGIVICIGNHQFQYAATTIRAIREILKSELPIEVFYIRENDLTPERRRYLETEFTNVRTRAVVDSINDDYTRFGGWALKPYSILASSFSEVLLMDADAFFFKRPEILFDDAGYRKTGALFFYDRTLFANWRVGRDWLSSFLPTRSSLVEKSRWWKYTSAHEQESGVVVINKRRTLLGLLAICKMNDHHERDLVTYKHVHGDKESFWIGFEMMQTPYAFLRSYGAVIGGLGDGGAEDTVCGNQLHLGVDKQPLWWNGGLLRDKNKWPGRYLTFTHYAEGEDWQFETSCIKETDRIRDITDEQRNLAMRYIDLDKQRAIDEEMINNGTWKPTRHSPAREASASPDIINDNEETTP